jgi:SAM-dependent methyltransferase
MQIDMPGFDIEASDTVVDIGCGDGTVCVYAGHKGAEVIGIDILPHLVEQTAAAMRGVPARSFRGYVSDANPIPLPDGIASVVVATEVLEHVDDPDAFLAELARIGRPGARYLISVPDPVSESVMKAIGERWYFEKPFHSHVFEHSQLDRLLEGAGLRLESRKYHGFYWSMYWFFRMAIGIPDELIYAPVSAHPLLAHWEATAAEMIKTPRGVALLKELDALIPKSQVVLVHKATQATKPLKLPSWNRPRWKRQLRDGAVRLGKYRVSWSIRRSA